MNRRTIITKRIKATGNHVLEIEMYYSSGGQNMFNGMEEPRGYWLSVTLSSWDFPNHAFGGVSCVPFYEPKPKIGLGSFFRTCCCTRSSPTL